MAYLKSSSAALTVAQAKEADQNDPERRRFALTDKLRRAELFSNPKGVIPATADTIDGDDVDISADNDFATTVVVAQEQLVLGAMLDVWAIYKVTDQNGANTFKFTVRTGASTDFCQQADFDPLDNDVGHIRAQGIITAIGASGTCELMTLTPKSRTDVSAKKETATIDTTGDLTFKLTVNCSADDNGNAAQLLALRVAVSAPTS